MNCKKAGDLLSAYVEGELAGRAGQAVEAHVTGCAGCREELETLRSALALLAAPKTPAQPEGMLEEFRTQYLPQAAPAAPRWSFRLPSLPRVEWPSLGRVMVPMGGLAAAAAAVLVVLHSQPVNIGSHAVMDRATRQQVAVLPGPPASEQEQPQAVMVSPEIVPMTSAAKPAIPPARMLESSRRTVARRPRPGYRPPLGAELSPAPRRRTRGVLTTASAAPRAQHRRLRHPAGMMLAKHFTLAAPVPEPILKLEALRHEQAQPTEESKWQDQVVVIQRKAAAAAVDDGFAEVSCKNLKTGETKSMAIGTPGETAGPEAASTPGDPAVDK